MRHVTRPTAMPPRQLDRLAPLRRNILPIGSATLGVVAFALGMAYTRPELTRPIPRPGARTVSIVQVIDQLGPIWTVAFVICGAALGTGVALHYLGSPRSPRILTMSHALTVGMHGAFAAAVWCGWAFSDPRPPAVSGILCTPLVVLHFLFALAYTAPAQAPTGRS